MKEISKMYREFFHVISEPGDGTRYDYYVIRNYDEFLCIPTTNTFRYPGWLNYHDVKNLNISERDDPEILELAEIEHCNPFTLRECIRTIKEIVECKA